MCRAISKMVLVIVNIVFAVFSILASAIGIWATVAMAMNLKRFNDAPEESGLRAFGTGSQLMVAAVVFTVLSFLCLIVSFNGCVGALKESSCMLTFYAVILAILVVVQLAAIGLAAAFSGKVNSELVNTFTKADRTFFRPYNQLEKNPNKTTSSDAVSHIMNSVHVTMKCCGVTNYTDITTNGTAWLKANPRYDGKAMKVPASCCKLTEDGVMKLADSTDWSQFNKYLVNGSKCPTEASDFHANGCLQTLKDTVSGHVTSVIISCSVYIGFNIICILMACCLIKKYKSRDL